MKSLKIIIVMITLFLPLVCIAQEAKTIEIDEFVITDKQFVETLDSIIVFENACHPDTSTMWTLYLNDNRSDTTQFILTKQPTEITYSDAVIIINENLLFVWNEIDISIINRTPRKRTFISQTPEPIGCVLEDFSTWVINYYNGEHHIIDADVLPCDKK